MITEFVGLTTFSDVLGKQNVIRAGTLFQPHTFYTVAEIFNFNSYAPNLHHMEYVITYPNPHINSSKCVTLRARTSADEHYVHGV